MGKGVWTGRASEGSGREPTERVGVENGEGSIVGVLTVLREASATDDALSLKEFPQCAWGTT